MSTANSTALTFPIKPGLKEALRTGVQSARFLAEHKKNLAAEFSIHGVEKTDETGRLCRRVPVRKYLAVHDLEGDIRHGGNVNSYYDDPHDATGRFDFVLANPPFDPFHSQWLPPFNGQLCRDSTPHLRNL